MSYIIKKKKFLICICTRNRPIKLQKLLKSINSLEKINDIILDVLVVENELKSKISKKKLKYKNFNKLKFVKEKNLGISYARNRCLHEASKIKTDYLVFVDDDCFLDKKWLLENLSFIRKFDCDIVTGPHLSINNTYINVIERNFKNAKNLSWASTNNVLIKKKILKKKFKFDLEIQKIGGEDQLFFMQLKKQGYKILWNNLSVVYEESSEERVSLKWFLKRSFGYGCSSFYIYKKLHKKIFYLIITLTLFYNFFRSMINFIKLPFNPKISILKTIHYIFKILGIFATCIFSYEIKRY